VQERRRSVRHTPEQLPDVVHGRIRPGHPVRIVNVSARGILIETSRRLLPGTFVVLHLTRGPDTYSTSARVTRSVVCALPPGGPVFRGALDAEVPVPWLPDERAGTGSHVDANAHGQ